MSSQDISPSSLPFHSKMREIASSKEGLVSFDAAYSVFEYVDIAKRILLEHRVRDFSASDVVALAAVIEARDRAFRLLEGGEE